jgi:hypothetical protein
MEQTAVVPVPRTGLGQVLRIVEREIESRRLARASWHEQPRARHQRERVNSLDIDLEEWYEVAIKAGHI